MNVWMIVGLVVTIAMILGLSIYSGTKFKAGVSKNGSAITAGIIMGTLVGGSSTVGTAQLAYNYGMSAWWFTLGGGIACLVLALVYVKPFRGSHCATLVQMVGHEYGPAAGLSASILNSVGTFINIISQLIAATAVITVLFPSLSMAVELLIAAAFMVLYVVFGGAKGAGMVGVLKLTLLYIAMIGCGIIVLTLTGGILVGLYMRATHPGIVAKTALTSFVMEHMPPVLAGIVMGTLFVAVVGTGAGLALGISFIVNKDIIKKFTHKLDNNPRLEAVVGKIITAAVLLLGCCLSTGSLGDTILQFAFMSMGLRGAVVLVPMCCALWLPGKIPHKFAMCSIIVAPLLVLLFGVMNVLPFDSLFIGIAASLVIMGIGYLAGRKQPLGAN